MLCNSYKANESHMVFTMDVPSALHEALRGEEVKGVEGVKAVYSETPPTTSPPTWQLHVVAEPCRVDLDRTQK